MKVKKTTERKSQSGETEKQWDLYLQCKWTYEQCLS